MPYSRRYKKRRRTRRRPRVMTARRVREIINTTAEVKESIHQFDHDLVPTAWAGIPMPTAAQGLTIGNRVGASVRIRGIEVNCWLSTNNASIPTRYRFVMVKCRGVFNTADIPWGAGVFSAPVDRRYFVVKYNKMGVMGTQVDAQANISGYVPIRYRRRWTGQTGPRVFFTDPGNPQPSTGMWTFGVIKTGTADIRISGYVKFYYQDL